MPGTPGPGSALTAEARLTLVAAGDDLLLEEGLHHAVGRATEALPGAAVEELPETASPTDVAVEVNSPSLFNPERILLVPDVSSWVIAPAAVGGPKPATNKEATAVDALVTSLVETLAGGAPEGVALVMGVWCGGKPTGSLVEAVEAAGTLEWIALPEPPKPWEDVAVSDAQKTVLRRLMKRAAPDARFTSAAEDLLFQRLGFAPRRLVRETEKLAVSAGPETAITDDLVRRLVLPREGSLEVLQDAILDRDPAAATSFLDSARRGLPIRDFSGAHIDDRGLGPRVFNLAVDSFTRMLYLRNAVRALGVEAELDADKTAARAWYSRTFKPRLAPKISAAIAADPDAPFRSGSRSKRTVKAPSAWALQRLFRAATLYSDRELVRCLIDAAAVERRLRRPGDSLAAVPAWLIATLARHA